MTPDQSENITDTLANAESAHISVAGLIELLRGCPAEYKLSAGLFLGLVVGVQSNLDNVVDGLRCVNRVELPLPVALCGQSKAVH